MQESNITRIIEVPYDELEKLIRHSEKLNLLVRDLKKIVDNSTLSYNKNLIFDSEDVKDLVKRWFEDYYQIKLNEKIRKEESDD